MTHAATVELEDELVEIALEMFPSEAVVDAERRSLLTCFLELVTRVNFNPTRMRWVRCESPHGPETGEIGNRYRRRRSCDRRPPSPA